MDPHERTAPAGRSEQEILIAAGEEPIAGTLVMPSDATALVLFAHGSGSSRFSPRNIAVADFLNLSGIATLLLDLLTPQEAELNSHTGRFRFDVDLLASRLIAGVTQCSETEELKDLPVGFFGASSGAAAAIIAAVDSPVPIGAIVSRGGRPDLARWALRRLTSPTLLIVDGKDPEVIEFNRKALMMMRTITALEIVPGATHLFEEPGALERVAELANDWFVRYLTETARSWEDSAP